MRTVKPQGRKESGTVIVLTAMMATVIFGVMGLAIEVSAFYSAKRKMQTAADAGAKAGAIEIWRASANIETEARRGATQNGYTNAVDGATVTVNHPPTSSRSDAAYHTSDYVEVIVQQTQNLHLMSILTNTRATTLTAFAVGGVVSRPNASIVVLNPTSRDAFVIGGGGSVIIEGAVQVNSNDSRAANVKSGGTLTASATGVTGGYVCAGTCTPTPAYAPVMPDPLAFLSPPAYSPTCDYTDFAPPSASTLTLNPGNYCGGINFSGNGNHITFNPGQYILIGNGFNAGGNTSTYNGTGVTFYNTWCKNTGDPCWSDKKAQTAGGLVFGGGTSVTMSAPTSGPMAGVLFFQDRAVPQGTVADSFTGGSTMCFTGAIYLKTSKLTYGGGGGVCGGWEMIVVDELEFSGGSTAVQTDFSGTVPIPTRGPSLVE